MKVNEKIMYHFHSLGCYDEMWYEGNQINVNDSFKANFLSIVDEYNTLIPCGGEDKHDCIDRVISYYLKDENFSDLKIGEIKYLLNKAQQIIHNSNIIKRELALEQYRLDNYPNLLSRFNSIWVCDEEQIEYWYQQLVKGDNLELYQLSLTGELFKSSDAFLPHRLLSYAESYLAAENYWNPKFKEKEDYDFCEYLFQGKAKILSRLK